MVIDPNRLKDVSAFLDFASTDLAAKLGTYFKALKSSGFEHQDAIEIVGITIQSILAIPSPVEK